MFLFIFESIGTSELLLIGIVALMFLGPRRMPEMARKLGKIMSEFRGTANEFKQTWEREVSFEEEVKALDIEGLVNEEPSIARTAPIQAAPAELEASDTPAPKITEIDPEKLEALKAKAAATTPATTAEPITSEPATTDPNDKQNWL